MGVPWVHSSFWIPKGHESLEACARTEGERAIISSGAAVRWSIFHPDPSPFLQQLVSGIMAGVRRNVSGVLVLVLAMARGSCSMRTSHHPAVPGRQQRLEMLSHWDHSFPLGGQFPDNKAVTRKYSPLEGTSASARTWTPNFPDDYVYRSVKVYLAPACNWPFEKVSGFYLKREKCDDGNMTDVRVRMHIKYENQHGKLTSGMRCLGDAPDPSEAPAVWDGEKDKVPNLRPFILKVEDSDGTPLQYHMHRNDALWWLDYDFAKPMEGRVFYDVVIEYQLQRVMQGSEQSNSFSAPWLREWNAPVKEMEIFFTFPPGFYARSFDVLPKNTRPGYHMEDWKHWGELHRITRACCGPEATDDVEGMETCTQDNDLMSVWGNLRQACEDKEGQVMLSTLLYVPSTQLEPNRTGVFGAIDDDVLEGMTEYSVSFSPGFVDSPWGSVSAVSDRDYWGVPWWGWLVLVGLSLPMLAAVFYTLATYGAMDFFLGQTSYKIKLQDKV
jgi:hypothetical protein